MLCKDTVGWHRGVGSQWRVYIHMCMGGCDDAQAWPRGATTRPRSGAKAGRTPYRRGCGQEELPHVQGQRRQPRGATLRPRLGAVAESARLQWHRNSQEELPHVRGQGWWPGGATPHPRSSGCAGAEEPRRAMPLSRSGGAVVRRYPTSKVKSSGCTLLEQPSRYPTPKVRETQVRW